MAGARETRAIVCLRQSIAQQVSRRILVREHPGAGIPVHSVSEPSRILEDIEAIGLQRWLQSARRRDQLGSRLPLALASYQNTVAATCLAQRIKATEHRLIGNRLMVVKTTASERIGNQDPIVRQNVSHFL